MASQCLFRHVPSHPHCSHNRMGSFATSVGFKQKERMVCSHFVHASIPAGSKAREGPSPMEPPGLCRPQAPVWKENVPVARRAEQSGLDGAGAPSSGTSPGAGLGKAGGHGCTEDSSKNTVRPPAGPWAEVSNTRSGLPPHGRMPQASRMVFL